MKTTLEVKVHDRDCGLLIAHGVIMTNEGQLMVGEGTRGNAVTLIMGSHQHTNKRRHHQASKVLSKDQQVVSSYTVVAVIIIALSRLWPTLLIITKFRISFNKMMQKQ